jgi:hypothetical protein
LSFGDCGAVLVRQSAVRRLEARALRALALGGSLSRRGALLRRAQRLREQAARERACTHT